MYIKQVIRNRENWWYYIFGIVLIVPAMTFIFSIPHGVAIAVKAFGDEELTKKLAENDFNAMMTILESNLNLFLMLFSFLGMLLGVFLTVKFIHKNSIRELTTSRPRIDWNRVFFSFLLCGSVSVIMIGIDYNFISTADYAWNFKPIPFLILFLICIVMIPIQTSAEEYLFRGYLMQGIGVITKVRWAPLLLTSILFGLMHYANPEIDKLGYGVYVFYIGSGLFAGIATLMDEGMELALGWHAANNFFTALLVTADWTALQTHSVLKDISNPESLPLEEVIISVFIFFPIYLYIFAKKYQWHNWSEKLFGKI